MTRDEHLAWAKERALEYVDAGDLVQAINSMHSDLSKHQDLAGHSAILLGGMLLLGGHLKEPREVREYIEGFN